jgi:hypothetical protein
MYFQIHASIISGYLFESCVKSGDSFYLKNVIMAILFL